MFGKLALLSLLGLALAAPVSETEQGLEKRITHTGQATYFYVGLGACGNWNVDSDPIVALNSAQYQANNGGNCGQWLAITNTQNGKTVNAYVADECPSCGDGSLDMVSFLVTLL
jgi:hypothetical protein